MQKKDIAILSLAGLLLMTITAGASVYLTKNNLTDDKPVAVATKHHAATIKTSQGIKWDNANQAQRTQVQTVQTASACDDDNIAGKAVGGVGGGVLGSMLGKGKGKTATTIGGTLAGAYAGGEVIPLKNATCR